MYENGYTLLTRNQVYIHHVPDIACTTSNNYMSN